MLDVGQRTTVAIVARRPYNDTGIDVREESDGVALLGSAVTGHYSALRERLDTYADRLAATIDKTWRLIWPGCRRTGEHVQLRTGGRRQGHAPVRPGRPAVTRPSRIA